MPPQSKTPYFHTPLVILSGFRIIRYSDPPGYLWHAGSQDISYPFMLREMDHGCYGSSINALQWKDKMAYMEWADHDVLKSAQCLFSESHSQFAVLFVVSVVGHLGRLVFGSLGGVDVVIMQGRIHAYEGHSMWQVCTCDIFVSVTCIISTMVLLPSIHLSAWKLQGCNRSSKPDVVEGDQTWL